MAHCWASPRAFIQCTRKYSSRVEQVLCHDSPGGSKARSWRFKGSFSWRDIPNSNLFLIFAYCSPVVELGCVKQRLRGKPTPCRFLSPSYYYISELSGFVTHTVEASLCLGWVYMPLFLFRFRLRITWHAMISGQVDRSA